MNQKTSLIGGTISFAAVLLLSFLSLDMVEGEGFFMQGLMPLDVSAPEVDVELPNVEGDSTDTLSKKKGGR